MFTNMIDALIMGLFVLFMVFIFGGYHKNKSAQRESLREENEIKKKKSSKKS